MVFSLVRRITRHVKARRARWTPETDRAFHDTIFATQDFDPFDPAYPGNITIRRFADLAAPHVATASHVGDLGCGPAEITCELASRYPSVRFTGWDHSQAAINRARALARSKGVANVRFEIADVGEMRVPADCDLVTMFDSFHHLPQPARFLATNAHVPRWFLIEPAADALGRWRYGVDLDWLLLELDKIRARLEHELVGNSPTPARIGSQPAGAAPDPNDAVEYRYALDDYRQFFTGFGLTVAGTSAGLMQYPAAPLASAPLRQAFNEFAYQLLREADATLRARDEDLAARHWAIYCARGERFDERVPRAVSRAAVEPDPIRGPYGVEYQILRAPDAAVPNEMLGVSLRVENRGFLPWSCTGDNRVNVSYHWLSPQHRRVLTEGLRTALARGVSPGEAITTHVVVQAPAAAGTYLLEFDLVHEGVTWFSEAGQPTATCTVRVRTAAD